MLIVLLSNSNLNRKHFIKFFGPKSLMSIYSAIVIYANWPVNYLKIELLLHNIKKMQLIILL